MYVCMCFVGSRHLLTRAPSGEGGMPGGGMSTPKWGGG